VVPRGYYLNPRSTALCPVSVGHPDDAGGLVSSDQLVATFVGPDGACLTRPTCISMNWL
jgi:hypothetical protein